MLENFKSLLETKENTKNSEDILKELEEIQEFIQESEVGLNDTFMEISIAIGKLVQQLTKRKMKKEAKEALDCLKKMSKSLEKAGGPSVY